MDRQVSNIIYKYKNNRNINIYSNKYFHYNSITLKIKSRKDIDIYRTAAVNLINYYTKSNFNLTIDNIIQIEKGIGIYELAVHKALQCYGMYDFNYTAEELQRLVVSIFEVYDLFAEVRLRKLCQN